MVFLLVLLLGSACGLGAPPVWERDFGGSSLFRTADFGVPVVQGGANLSDVWAAVGYAQTRDRFFQLFLRLAAGAGRLGELVDASEANVRADMLVRQTGYAESELAARFARLDAATRATYEGYVRGMALALDVMLAEPLPYEFHALNITDVPRDLFSLTSILHFSVFTMRRLAAGWDPLFQLENLKLMDALQQAHGNDEAEDIFHDLVTTVDTFPVSTVVVNVTAPIQGGDTSPASSARAAHKPSLAMAPRPTFSPDLHGKRLETANSVWQHLHDMGAVNQDGSWAAVARSTNGNSYTEFGPQDDNNFPTTFYQVYVDSEVFSAMWFTEPGMPMNQIYGVAGNFSFGRNRGYAYCNDYLTEPSSQAVLNRTETLKLRNGTTIEVPIYRSKSGGFVVENPGNGADVLTLRTAFLGSEMDGLNMLSKLVLCKSLDEMISTLLVRSQQSCTIHSHMQVSDANTVGAVLNGLITSLQGAQVYDRRFPTVWNASGLPQYIVHLPRYQLNEQSAYYSWNTPFDYTVPWTSSYPYGGEWRSEWIGRFLGSFSKQLPLNVDGMLEMPTFMNRGNALELGGDGPTDRFAQHVWPKIRKFVPPGKKYNGVKELLDGFEGFAFDDIEGHNLREDYVLANSWLYAMIEAIFVPVLGRDSPVFPVPQVPAPPAVPILPTHPSRRFASIVILLLDDKQQYLLHFKNWTAVESIVVSTLDSTLERLGPRPWGVGARPNATMKGLAGAFPDPVRQLPDAQLPSINGAVEISYCGMTRFSSILPLGQSGLVSVGQGGEPVFSAHALDQFPLYVKYKERDFPLLFNSTETCLKVARDRIRRVIVIVTAALIGVVFMVLLASFVYWKCWRKPVGYSKL